MNNRKSPAKALLDGNEIGCARISVMAGEQLPPSKGRIQMSRTNYLQTFKFGLQRAAGSIQMCHSLTHALQQTIYTGWNASLTPRRIVNGFGGAGTGPGNSYVSNQAPVATNARVAHVIGRRGPCANAMIRAR